MNGLAGDRSNTSNRSSLSGMSESPRALYVHVPFCVHRCGYCNFTLVARRDDLIPRYLNAIEQELAQLNGGAAPVFEINGLKREEMIASGSMILHEVYFDSLGVAGR